ncbi:N-acetylmuramic acid 6-phosphate etherase [Candidatus Sumerlaeota bacterium]|nr:N-acetylmuramic acid 6-phosphate etherase [Candidatus Sumerlaeota bacterium]
MNSQAEQAKTIYVLGVDGGGAHTRACVMDGAGRELGHGAAESSNLRAVGLEAACAQIHAAIHDAIAAAKLSAPLDAMHCALSGAGRLADAVEIRALLEDSRLAHRVSVGHDAEGLLAAASVRTGIVLIAGTGSIAWGMDENGEQSRVDGWGSLLGDAGSGFAIGLAGICAALKMFDHRKAETSLLQAALQFYAVADPSELVALLATPNIPRGKIAAFAREVFAAAEAEDTDAIEIIERAAQELADMLSAVRRRLFGEGMRGVRIAASGGLLTHHPEFWEDVRTRHAALFPADEARLITTGIELGAARLALHGMGIDLMDTEQPAGTSVRPDITDSSDESGIQTAAPPNALFEQLGQLATERRNPASMRLDRMSALEIVRLMNREDAGIASAVKPALPRIAEAVDRIVERLHQGGRLFYIGAGTSGRLAMLDAAECPPTFSAPTEQVQGVIAGGEAALTVSQEGAEDDEDAAVQDLQESGLNAGDMLVGLTASGRTPYVLSGLRHAHALGAATAMICCNRLTDAPDGVEILIDIETGPEVLTGSSRLKAGTAQKMILNMLTTAAFTRLGKVYENLMVDLQPSCGKLVERSRRVVMQAARCDYAAAVWLLEQTNGDVKAAILLHQKQP